MEEKQTYSLEFTVHGAAALTSKEAEWALPYLVEELDKYLTTDDDLSLACQSLILIHKEVRTESSLNLFY